MTTPIVKSPSTSASTIPELAEDRLQRAVGGSRPGDRANRLSDLEQVMPDWATRKEKLEMTLL